MKKWLSILLFLFFIGSLTTAQTHINSTLNGKVLTSQPFLIKPIDPISAALGYAKIAAPPSSSSMFHNATNLLHINNLEKGITANYLPLTLVNQSNFENVYQLSLGGYYRTSLQNLFTASLRYSNFGKIGLVSETFQSFGVVHPFDLAMDIGYARKITSDLNFSATLRYIFTNNTGGGQVNSGNSDLVQGHSFATDLNLSYLKRLKNKDDNIIFNLGFSNLGATLGNRYTYSFQPYLPANMGLGISYKKTYNADAELTLLAEFNKMLVPVLYVDSVTGKLSDDYLTRSILKSYAISFADNHDGALGELSEVSIALGAQFLYDERIYFRIGFFHDAKTLSNTNTLGLGLGLRFLDNCEINISYNTYLTTNQILMNSLSSQSLRVGFTYQIFSSFFDAKRGRINKMFYK